MGLDSLTDEDLATLVGRVDKSSAKEITLADLKDAYGDEPVRRAIAYMESLREADKNHRDVGDEGDEYSQEFAQGIMGGAAEDADLSDAQSSWEEAMKDSGIGLDDG